MVYNVVIIGSGPAGLTAGIYAARAKLQPLIIDGPLPGGQLMTTTKVENWPGTVSIMGPDLMINMREHAQASGASFVSENVASVDFSRRPFTVVTDSKKTIQAKSIIIATGAVNKKLACKGEAEYWGNGVSTCATCDAPFYEGREVVVVGGGNTAMTEAEHLTHVAKKVTIIHILDKLSATDPIKEKVLVNPKVQIIYNTTVVEIMGDGKRVTGAMIENKKDKKRITVNAEGVFIAIGFKPNTEIFKNHIAMDQYGYITVSDHTRTNIDGVFAAGDVADYRYRQAITSSGVGCMAALDAQNFLAGK